MIYDKFVSATSVKISTVIMILVVIVINGESFFPSANAQGTTCHNLDSKIALPILLIHGWDEGLGGDIPIHFDQWERQLNQERIPFCTISFQQSSDACGSAADHATELGQIIQNIKGNTSQNQVNIVGYSKGGLDARVYLDNSNIQDVANLIMIGTPNFGTPMAFTTNDCWPAIEDLKPGALATYAQENTHTKYYTIAGTCGFSNGPFSFDGLVYEGSVNYYSYFNPLGESPACHPNLLGVYEYELAHDVLKGKQ